MLLFKGKKYSLTKTALNKLSSAAGLTITSRIIESSKDYVCAEATATYLNASGAREEKVGTYEIDMDVIEAEIMERPKKGEWDTEAKRKEESRRFRRYKLQRCETGAINRVIRSILAVKNAYTQEELQKPFAVPHVQFAPDFSDPDIKRATIKKFTGQSDVLFGKEEKAAEVAPPPVEEETPQIEEAAPDQTDLTNVITALKFACPKSGCPTCAGNAKEGCKLCRGTGWISLGVHDRLPAEMK